MWHAAGSRHAVSNVDRGGLFSTDERLLVGGTDRTSVIRGMAKQVDAVRAALAGDSALADLPVVPVVCFVSADWSLFARPFKVRGVIVEWPQSLAKRLGKPGPLDSHVVAAARAIDTALPRAARARRASSPRNRDGTPPRGKAPESRSRSARRAAASA